VDFVYTLEKREKLYRDIQEGLFMNRPSGFEPIPFPLVGKILVGSAAVVFALYLLSVVFQWFTLPMPVLALGTAAALIGLYLIFVVPKEDVDSK